MRQIKLYVFVYMYKVPKQRKIFKVLNFFTVSSSKHSYRKYMQNNFCLSIISCVLIYVLRSMWISLIYLFIILKIKVYMSAFVSISKVYDGVDMPTCTEIRSAQRQLIPCSWSYKCLPSLLCVCTDLYSCSHDGKPGILNCWAISLSPAIHF